MWVPDPEPGVQDVRIWIPLIGFDGPAVSGNDLLDWLAAVNVDSLPAGNFESLRIETPLIQHRRVDVGDVVWIFDGVKAKLIGHAVSHAALDAAACQPTGEALRVMVTAGWCRFVARLSTRCAAEFGSENYERRIEKAALFEILQQPRNRLVDLRCLDV